MPVLRSMRVAFCTDIYGVNDGVQTIVTLLEEGAADVFVRICILHQKNRPIKSSLKYVVMRTIAGE